MFEELFGFLSELALNVMLECCPEFFAKLLLGAVWLVLLPVFWIVSLPFILLSAPFHAEAYGGVVTAMLRVVFEAWRNWGESIANWGF